MALNIVTGVSFVPFIVWPVRSLMMGYVIVRMWLSGSTLQDAGCELYLMQRASLIDLIIKTWETNAVTSSVWTCLASQPSVPCVCLCACIFFLTCSTRTSWRGTPTSFRSCCSDGSDTRTGPSWATRRWPWDSSTWPRYHNTIQQRFGALQKWFFLKCQHFSFTSASVSFRLVPEGR